MNIVHFYRSILENLPQVILVASAQSVPETGQTDFLIEYVNPAWERLSGALMQTVQGKLLSQTVYAKTSIPWCDLGGAVLQNGKTIHNTLYSDLLDKWLDISVSRIEEKYICTNITDVSDVKQGETRLKEQNLRLSSLSAELASSRNNLKRKLDNIEKLNTDLEQLAYYDRLTGLPNRILFTRILSDEIQNVSRSGKKMALAILDIDNLKPLNDSRGHDTGDELLRQMAKRLGTLDTPGIQASRFGGDEFLLIIRNYKNDEDLEHTVNAIQEKLRESYFIYDTEIKSSVSIGVATYPDDADDEQNLLKYADIAMTDAKRCGKNTLALFHSIMKENLLARINLEQRMFRAITEKQFQLFFQPQFDVRTSILRGFEALIRWFDPELGYVSPEKFIPLAEENRSIIPLGSWIMRTACQTMKKWQSDFCFSGIISVNVSPVQLQYAGFVDDLKKIITETGIKPASLEIEITEGVLINDFGSSIKILHEIKDTGVGISLDDFGTGYSSLSYLQYLPLTTLKIDKSFISNITKEQSVEYDITDAIVALVNKLGLDTIAEGVETNEQYDMIRKINCKTIQGFLTGRPMPESDCLKLITKQNIVRRTPAGENDTITETPESKVT